MIVNPSNFQTTGIGNRSSNYNPQLLNIKNKKSKNPRQCQNLKNRNKWLNS